MSEQPASDPLPVLDDSLLDDFYAECDELLGNIRHGVVKLESSLNQPNGNPAVLNDVFRYFHTFKGIAAIVGLRSGETLAHECEDYLRELTQNRKPLSRDGVDLLMTTASKLEQIVIAFREKKSTAVPQSLVHALQEAASAGSSKVNELWICTFVPTKELDARGINISSIRARLAGLGEIISAAPKVLGPGSVAFEYTVSFREPLPDFDGWSADGLMAHPADITPAEEVAQSENATVSASSFITPSHVVRVDMHKLDELMRVTGDMVILRSRFEDQLNQFRRNPKALDFWMLNEVHVSLGRSLRDLRRAIMSVRMVPVAEIFDRMPFAVRDLAQASRKRVRLLLEGQHTELDKYLIERLKEPLLHLVRNAVSHGIETSEQRHAAAKPEDATIVLRASTQSDAVVIEIEDDGAGINVPAVLAKAKSAGLPVPEHMNDTALLELLCRPGFSTRDDADLAAGRGVGMAVVRDTIRELGGSISLETRPGRGTRFTLRLPLTLAITDAFIISGAGQLCAIPQSYVSEVLQVEAGQIRTVNRVELVPYRSGVLPVTRLSTIFKLPPSASPQLSVLVLSSERGQNGLVVDRVHGQKEIVVRALRDPLVMSPAIIGGTELGDGKPVLILDGATLTSGAVKPHEAAEPALQTS